MFIGNDSAIKGFFLFALLILAILILIATTLAPGVWWILGILNLGCYAYVIVKLYKQWQV